MLIDWFTVGAQALNFLILVWLLQHFLYQPILNAIDAREKGIAAKLADAEAKKREAQKEHDDFENKNKAFDEQRGALLTKATDDAKTEHDHLLDQARKDADNLRTVQAAALRSDQIRLGSEITRAAAEEVFAIARKTLADLATASLEERAAAAFARRLDAMDGKAKETLGAALKTSSEPGVVQSAFDLPAAQKAMLQNALNVAFSAEIRVRFETAPDKICGIELMANGQKVGWSIADYLTSLNRKVSALLDAPSQPVPQAAPKPEPAAIPAGESGVHAVTK
jgi:F-type H+-transporting ATPase subunit b